MYHELDMLCKNSTYKLVPLSAGRKAIGVKWIFKVKLNPDGSINKYKARLVAKGFRQKKGIDYYQTYAPVVKMASIRTILTVATANNLRVDQLDVESAYFNGEMDTEVYMEQLPGFIDKKHPNYVCRLWKALYGLKQAGNRWNVLVNTYLLELGFTRSLSDSCIYTKNHERELIIVGLYVNDFIYASKPHIND
jgi:hypothetical protein